MTLAAALAASLVHFLWLGALVALMIQGVLASMRARSAQARYLVATTGLGVLALVPVVTTLWFWTTPTHAMPDLSAIGWMPAAGILTVPARLAVIEPRLLAWWCAGVCLCSLRLGLGAAHASVMVRRGARVSVAVLASTYALASRMHVCRPVRVLMSDVADSPSVIGCLRPVILLPMATLAGLSLNQLDAVIAHELAHIRRHDFVVNLGQMLIEAGLFYHPAVWWVSARIRHERELCCDDLVIAFEHNPLDYARALASLERFRLSAALRLGADGGQLTYRIKRLIGADTGRRPVPRYPAVVASVIAILAGLAVVSSSHVSATTPQATEPSRVAMARPQAEPDSAERGSPVVPPAGAAGDDNGEQSSLDILAASQLEPPPGDAIAWAVGRRLVTIQLLGVPNAERDALHLPIGIGDRIGSETAEEVSVAVADVARHLVVRLLPLPNDGVAILISRAPVPGV